MKNNKRQEREIKRLREAKKLVNKALKMLRNYDTVTCDEFNNAPSNIDEMIGEISILKRRGIDE